MARPHRLQATALLRLLGIERPAAGDAIDAIHEPVTCSPCAINVRHKAPEDRLARMLT